MKKGTKITVFILTVALTAGTLCLTLGPKHCYTGKCGNYSNCNADKSCSDTKGNTTYPVPEGK